jgi:PTS system ascorbate-specific IIA component
MKKLAAQLLALDSIHLQAEAADWKEAVRIGVDLLVRADTVEPRYYDAIIRMTEELGPWYVLAPGMAMPHGRPEEGVKKNSFALVTLKTPVNFGEPDNDPIDILVTLAATDAKTMTEDSIVAVATFLDDEDRIRRLRAAKTRADLEAIFADLS